MEKAGDLATGRSMSLHCFLLAGSGAVRPAAAVEAAGAAAVTSSRECCHSPCHGRDMSTGSRERRPRQGCRGTGGRIPTAMRTERSADCAFPWMVLANPYTVGMVVVAEAMAASEELVVMAGDAVAREEVVVDQALQC